MPLLFYPLAGIVAWEAFKGWQSSGGEGPVGEAAGLVKWLVVGGVAYAVYRKIGR
jgi:hypothetical protein